MNKQERIIKEALQSLVRCCPRLAKWCYWAGTSSIAIEELKHRQSFDLDFHTRKALQDVRPILTEILAAFPNRFEILQAPDEFGSAFRGVLTLPNGEGITVEVLSNYEDIAEKELVKAKSAAGMKRVSLGKYLADKIQCIAERTEARDLVDILAVIRANPDMRNVARALVRRQDALILAERLLAWRNRDIERDLRAYRDVNPTDAKEARDLLLVWLKQGSNSRSGRRNSS